MIQRLGFSGNIWSRNHGFYPQLLGVKQIFEADPIQGLWQHLELLHESNEDLLKKSKGLMIDHPQKTLKRGLRVQLKLYNMSTTV